MDPQPRDFPVSLLECGAAAPPRSMGLCGVFWAVVSCQHLQCASPVSLFLRDGAFVQFHFTCIGGSSSSWAPSATETGPNLLTWRDGYKEARVENTRNTATETQAEGKWLFTTMAQTKQQDNNSSRKQGHTSRIQQLQKKWLIAFGEINSSQSAGPERHGCHSTFGTLASTWAPAVGQPVRVRWVPHSTHKKKGPQEQLRISY